MINYLSIGSTPCNEPCQQLGAPTYDEVEAKKECARFRDLIRKKLGAEPVGARLVIKGHSHDFGTYYELECQFDPENDHATTYAFLCESKAPQDWEEQIEPKSLTS